MIPVPCKGCSRRLVGCHSTCEEYAAYRAEKDRQNQARIDFLAEMQISESLRKSIKKASRRKKR